MWVLYVHRKRAFVCFRKSWRFLGASKKSQIIVVISHLHENSISIPYVLLSLVYGKVLEHTYHYTYAMNGNFLLNLNF